MKVRYLKYDDSQFPPKLWLAIDGAPHYRQSKEVFDAYRKVLNEAWASHGYTKPIDMPVDVEALFIDPASPDVPNVGLALSRALDGKVKKGILKDDGLISEFCCSKFYPCPPNKSEQRIP